MVNWLVNNLLRIVGYITNLTTSWLGELSDLQLWIDLIVHTKITRTIKSKRLHCTLYCLFLFSSFLLFLLFFFHPDSIDGDSHESSSLRLQHGSRDYHQLKHLVVWFHWFSFKFQFIILELNLRWLVLIYFYDFCFT